MLAYVLALVVAAGSLIFYLAAFFLPEVHRRQDFIWSGVGLFYALVLWSCAGRITGAVLLGQMASVALLGGLAWQTLALRREMTPAAVRTTATWQAVGQWLDDTSSKVQGYFQGQSLAAAGGAIFSDMQRAMMTLRQRIAGPRGGATPGIQAAPSPPPAQPSVRRPAQGDGTSAPGLSWRAPLSTVSTQMATVTRWGRERLNNVIKPKAKPKRAVIDIPPRAPSIPRPQSPTSGGEEHQDVAGADLSGDSSTVVAERSPQNANEGKNGDSSIDSSDDAPSRPREADDQLREDEQPIPGAREVDGEVTNWDD